MKKDFFSKSLGTIILSSALLAGSFTSCSDDNSEPYVLQQTDITVNVPESGFKAVVDQLFRIEVNSVSDEGVTYTWTLDGETLSNSKQLEYIFPYAGEYELTLTVSQKLKSELEDRGYTVVLTRDSNDVPMSCVQRATVASDADADAFVRIHANGSEDPSAQGALCLVMSRDNPYVGELYEESSRLAESVLAAYCDATGFANQGVVTNDTMTGLNWSEIPVMILEMGFMTNEHDDTKMADEAFQKQMAEGIVEGIDAYMRTEET